MPGSETSKRFLGTREKALEEAFFEKENRRLIDRLRAEQEELSAKEGLARISGIGDEALLDKLVELSISEDTWAALSLVPLVEVAWSDAKLESRERREVLSAAEASGVVKGSPSYALLEAWLEKRPGPALLEAWGATMSELCRALGEADRKALRNQVMARARKVAEAHWGILGILNRVPPESKRALAELEKAFDG